MSSANKSRQPRLRASCDGCFLAKVKCSKARPICSRCLACGIECRYSPSSRSGKPKAENCGTSLGTHGQDIHELRHIVEDKNMSFTASVPPSEHLFRVNAGWATPPNSADGTMSRNPSISAGLGMMGVDENPMHNGSPMPAPPEVYSSTIPWTPPADFTCAPFPESIQSLSGPHVRSQSIDMSLPMPMTWSDPNVPDNAVYSQMPTPTGSLSSNYFPSPSTTPTMRPNHNRHKSSPPVITGISGSCTCFTVCLQSLQALHNASAPANPTFDLVLSLNRKAVEGCAAMLACSKCMSRSGTHTAAMLLATVMGKITSFYQSASHTHFENGAMGISPANMGGGPFGVSLGAYQLNSEDGRWLELEILARELRKLEELYARFREVCGDLSDDPEVSRAMIGYLGQNLGSTLEVVSHRKGGVSFA